MKYTVGNLLKAKERYIAHGCNAQGVMGSGVALAIRKVFPEAYNAYRQQHELNGLELGDVMYVLTRLHPQKVICNCITQKFFGKSNDRFVDYDAVQKSMISIREHTNNETIAMPKIGAGLGGGDWKVISKIIQKELPNRVNVYVLNVAEIPD